MIGFATPLFGRGENAPPPPAGPIDPTTLFVGGIKGGYYDFTDGASMAVNADGTGGVPAVGAACRSVLDKSGNANRLRNTVGTVTRRATGIETSGASYGLFNMGGFGDWPGFDQPFEIVTCLEQLAYAGNDGRIIASDGAALLQGAASGEIRQFAGGNGATVGLGLNAEKVIDAFYHGTSSGIAIDGGAMVPGPATGGAQMTALVLGSTTGGGNPTQIRVKHLLVIARALSANERAGVVQWMQA